MNEYLLHRRDADYLFIQEYCFFVEPILEKGISFFRHKEWNKREMDYHFFQIIFNFLPELKWARENCL
jgi:hypothetical protein